MASCLDRVWLTGGAVKEGLVPEHVRMGMSPLYIVRVRTLRPTRMSHSYLVTGVAK